jgi:O-antigen biosynthesis protein
VPKLHKQFARGWRQTRRIWSAAGVSGLLNRLQAIAADKLAPKSAALPVLRSDVLAADLSKPPNVQALPLRGDEAPIINWITVPAQPNSGGHTTIFRMIRYLESHGYRNRLYFYNVYDGDPEYYAAIAREAYGFSGPLRVLDAAGMDDAHAIVATSWATAYPVYNARSRGKRFYFVQDYEPWFYPVGALSLLAENTYRMGLHAITAGKWLSTKLRSEFAMQADFFDFGCDTASYSLLPGKRRNGIVFYARPEAARRGFELGLMTMELFASQHPDVELHIYGERMGRLPFRCHDHGRVSPEQLNLIYNQCFAGLSLSLTNVSLVPQEMLAAGCIPVMNDAEHNRLVLDNAFIRYAKAYPQALANELSYLVRQPDFAALSVAAAASVRGTSWDDAGGAVDAILRQALAVDVAQHSGVGCL